MNKRRGGLSLLLQAGRFFFEKEESDDIPEEPQPRTKKNNRDPMIVFWESAKNQLDKIDEPYKDSFIEDVGLDSIPDTTEKAVVEHRYDFDSLSRVYLPEAVQNFEFTGNVENSILNYTSNQFRIGDTQIYTPCMFHWKLNVCALFETLTFMCI